MTSKKSRINRTMPARGGVTVTSAARHDYQLLEFERSDLGNAERLVACHGQDLRYCPAWKRWLIWNGQCWCPDEVGTIIQRAAETVRAFGLVAWEQAPPGAAELDESVRWALASESSAKI